MAVDGRRGACCRNVSASVAVAGYASTTSASALVVGSCDPTPLTQRRPATGGGAGHRAAGRGAASGRHVLCSAFSDVDFVPCVLLSSVFSAFSALSASIVSAQTPVTMRAREPEHERRLAAAPVLEGGANLSAEAESLADFAKVGTPFPPHPSWRLPRQNQKLTSRSSRAISRCTQQQKCPCCRFALVLHCARSIRILPHTASRTVCDSPRRVGRVIGTCNVCPFALFPIDVSLFSCSGFGHLPPRRVLMYVGCVTIQLT